MRIQMPMSNSEVSGIEVGDNDAAQRVIDSMPEALSKQFVARNGRIAHRGYGSSPGCVRGVEALR